MTKLVYCLVFISFFLIPISCRGLAEIRVNAKDVNSTNVFNDLENYNVESNDGVIIVSNIEGTAAQNEVIEVILGEVESFYEGELEWNIVETGLGEYFVGVEEEILVASGSEVSGDSTPINGTSNYLFAGIRNALSSLNRNRRAYNNAKRLVHPLRGY